jgi:UDP-N-acetylmuramoyl-tripeptide--D-alanyl-D-alanine ligase
MSAARRADHADRRKLQCQPCIDERGDGAAQATPVSGDGGGSPCLATCSNSAMAKLHAGLADLIVGTETRTSSRRPGNAGAGRHFADEIKTEYRIAEDLKPVLLSTLKPGDVVMIKSSKGIGFSKLVDALLGKFPAEATTNKQG